ncbi:hypothetical protein HC031_14250 [Planosporangium thailandense]|uniref:Uncharacterized protein n=1 Tax=Planosporangium thailandense TaxID=765197 RepID=A0ABX0Y083_9ACTN|nr:hypothetical protein [Planosporangium thailandense]NJC70869.1 hypothetical protein [Planosporangium thailandense]
MDIAVHASFLSHDDQDGSLAFHRGHPEAIFSPALGPVETNGQLPGEHERPTAKSPSGTIGLSISELPICLRARQSRPDPRLQE